MSRSWELLEGKKKPATEWARQGKPEWRDCLELRVSPDVALALAERLIRVARLSHETLLTFYIHGELNEVPDE